jgi:hypothetical protein
MDWNSGRVTPPWDTTLSPHLSTPVAGLPLGWHKEMFAHALYRWTNHVAFKYMPRWPDPANKWGPYPARSDADPGLVIRLAIAEMPYASWTLQDYEKSTDEHWAEYELGDLPGPWYLPEIQKIQRRTRPSHLLNLIVTQMIGAVTSATGIYECSICGEPFTIRHRRPQKRQEGVERRKLCGRKSCETAASRQRASKSYYKGKQ